MITIPGRIPITIRPTFWILCLLIGFINGGGNPIQMLIWTVIIFVSVLFHEMGHALTALMFGRHPRIELVALGGVTYHDSSQLRAWKRFLITFNGPLFGFLLAIIATILLAIPGLVQNPYATTILRWVQVVNVFWTLINLLPVVPLDGGQLLQIILEKIFGVKGIVYGLLASTGIAIALSLVCFLFQAFLAGAFFFFFAYQGYVSWRQARMMSSADRKESLQTLFDEAEKKLQAEKPKEAAPLFEKIRTEAKKGLLYTLSTQYLALIAFEAGRMQEAYDLLLPIRAEISGEAIQLLHCLAFEVQNYPLVAELASASFELAPNLDTALRNAYATASMGQVEPAIGWLETAHQEGLENIEQVVTDKAFDPIRSSPPFQKYLQK